MSDITDTLNRRFALPGLLAFGSGAGGLACADVTSPQATARIYLQGAHVAHWQPRAVEQPVLWLSDAAKFIAGKPIRGGVPVCWPWFGPHPTDPALPAHGVARAVDWVVTGTRALDGGRVAVTFELPAAVVPPALWPHPFHLTLRATVGEHLELELETINPGQVAYTIGEALHAYFRIGDVAAIQVIGLERSEYIDKLDADRRKRQEGPVRFDGEVDRVYDESAAACVIDDPQLGRRIRVAKQGSASTIVWTPWQAKAERLGDLGAGGSGQGGWREMVCIESGNALARCVTLAPGASHRLQVDYSVAARG